MEQYNNALVNHSGLDNVISTDNEIDPVVSQDQMFPIKRRPCRTRKELQELANSLADNNDDEMTESEIRRSDRACEAAHTQMCKRNMVILRKEAKRRFSRKEIIKNLQVLNWEDVANTSIDVITSMLGIDDISLFDTEFVHSYLQNLLSDARYFGQDTTSELTWSSYSNYHKYYYRPKKLPFHTLF